MARKMRKFREGDFVSFSEELTGAPKRKLPGQSDYVSTESATETVSDTSTKPKKQTFAEAFKAARAKAVKEGRDPSKEIFTWNGEKKVARLAGEGAKRAGATSAPTRQGKLEDKPNNTGASETPKTINPYTTKRDSVPLRAKPTAAAERREKLGKFLTKISSLYTPGAKSKPWLLTGEAAREANRKQGTIGGKAKGGKIDGAAIRGKTRAMKKGK
jgi:hypothetical protein